MCCMSFYGQVWDSSKPDSRVTFGIRAGANLTSWNMNVDYYDYLDTKSVWGFQGGVNVDINVVKSFAVETGLFYSQKNLKLVDKYYDDEWPTEYGAYLQIPLQAVYKLPLANDLHLQVKAGGYAAYMVKEPDIQNIKKFDAGFVFGLGFDFKKIYLGAQFELGMAKIHSDSKPKNRTLSISLGYDF